MYLNQKSHRRSSHRVETPVLVLLRTYNRLKSLTCKGRLDTCLNGKAPSLFQSAATCTRLSCSNKEDNSVPNRILPRKQPGIYMVHCLQNDWRYYGESKNVSGRLASHKSLLNRGIHPNQNLQLDWDLYGSSHFDFIVLYMGDLWEDVVKRRGKETELIILDRNLAYNILETSSRPGDQNPFWARIHSTETKKKISQALKNRPNDLLGRQISIHGVIYPSIAEASRQTNIARTTIRKRIEDKNNKFYLAINDAP